MKQITIYSLEEFIREIHTRTKSSDLYIEILDKIGKSEYSEIDGGLFKSTFLINEYKKLNSAVVAKRKENVDKNKDAYYLLELSSKMMNYFLDPNAKKYVTDRNLKEIDDIGEYFKENIFNIGNICPLEFYYRGEAGSQWDTTPSVLRDDYFWSRESFFYHEIQVRCPSDFDNLTFLGKLVTMQHYACPTRLLDITANPLNALYFACESRDDLNGKVIFFPMIQGTISYGDADRALILSCIPHLTHEDQQMLYSDMKKDFEKLVYKGDPSLHYLNKLLLEIKTEKPSFEPRIEYGDLLNPLLVQPNMTNPRIANQQGAFLLSGLSKNHDDIVKKINARIADTQIIIPKEKKKDILKQLNSIGINKGTIYPNMEQVAAYLKSL